MKSTGSEKLRTFNARSSSIIFCLIIPSYIGKKYQFTPYDFPESEMSRNKNRMCPMGKHYFRKLL